MAKFCANCGSQCEDNYMNCPYCGTSFGASQQATNTQQNGQYNQQQYGQPYNQNNNYQADLKSKMAAGILGIFLGAYGVHNFYLGNTSRGVLQIVLTLVTCGVAGIWGFIEGILILCGNINTDSQGRPLKD